MLKVFAKISKNDLVIYHHSDFLQGRNTKIGIIVFILPLFAHDNNQTESVYLKSLHLVDFKNYESVKTDFHPKINVITGRNGMGKTNILDAIYYLSFSKSNFQSVDRNCVRHEQAGFRVAGVYQEKQLLTNVSVKLEKGKKKEVSVKKKQYNKLSDHIGRLPLVIICPDDISDILEGSEARRRLIDQCICQMDKAYLNTLIKYNRILKQRNAYLKDTFDYQIDHAYLDTLDEQLLDAGSDIFTKRQLFIEAFLPLLKDAYQDVSGQAEAASISYVSKLADGNIKEQQIETRSNDIRLRRTTFGIHKDDYVLTLDDYGTKKYGSQGQIKSSIIALKLAQSKMLSAALDKVPMLLLDDIFDKLDSGRVKNLLALVTSDAFGQIFISDTEKDRISDILNELKLEYSRYEIVENTVKKI